MFFLLAEPLHLSKGHLEHREQPESNTSIDRRFSARLVQRRRLKALSTTRQSSRTATLPTAHELVRDHLRDPNRAFSSSRERHNPALHLRHRALWRRQFGLQRNLDRRCIALGEKGTQPRKTFGWRRAPVACPASLLGRGNSLFFAENSLLLLEKFPVPLHREFFCKAIELAGCLRAKIAP